MKKTLKIIGFTILIILALLIAIPFMFQSQIKDMVKRFINENLNANVEFSDVNLSLLRSFPQAHVSVSDLVITNFEPFKDETFATAKTVAFEMSVKELFKKADDEPIIVNSIQINETLLTLKTNKFGDVNYDIVKKRNSDASVNNNSKSFSFDIKDYSIKNSTFTYLDEDSNMKIYVTEIEHSGKGSFSESLSELDTNTEAYVSFSIDSTEYLSNNRIKLAALLDLDLETDTYTFKENSGFINELPIEFNGFVKLLETGQDIDIQFQNSGASFKDFLAVIPKAYAQNLDQVNTTGDFKLNGLIKGINNDISIPNLDINMVSNNASFKYPDLPKRVENITIDASLKNDNGKSDDTYVDIRTLNFKIDEDVFKSSAVLRNLGNNMMVNANVDGSLNLANITKAYPIKLEKQLSGLLKMNLNSSFDMKALETSAFERIKTKGTMQVKDFIFSSQDVVNPIHISNADMNFNSGTVDLKSFQAKTGTSDLNATGTIKNLLGFLLSDNTLQGNFNVRSNTFVVSDFMVEDDSDSVANKKTDSSESLKIPSFLDCVIYVDAKTVLYDNLILKNVKGDLTIKDEEAQLNNMTSQIFDGELAISGTVNTKTTTPTFKMNLGVNGFDVSQSFKELELLQAIAPIAKIIKGKLNTIIKLNGTLDKSFSPKLESVSGNAFAELLTSNLDPKNNAILSTLESSLNFIDFEKLDLKEIKTKLEFENGHVSVKPFDIKYEDILITVAGSHSFDKSLNYTAVFQVPAKYLGSEVNRLLGKIDDQAVSKISIPVTANIVGSYDSPKVSTDLSSGITNLTKQLIDIQKQKLLNQGTNQIKDIVKDVLNQNGGSNTSTPPTNPRDSTKTTTVEEGIKNIFGNIFNKPKKKDSIP